jgi:alpha-glucosidase
MRRWKQAVIYEIYVRSFHDASGDGIGDLAGVLARLDHVRELGADAIWLTPIHPSPDRDFGYDVVDYTSVHPALGTLDDVDRLVAAAHEAGIAVLLDWVVNHTSDRHPWFAESRTSAGSPRRDWYLWRAAPNNWRSRAGGSAWQLDPRTGEHYLHTFLPEQPDLNWRNPRVREAIASAMRFWLDRGVDGFRLDILPLLIKDARFRHDPDGQPRRYTVDQPEMLEVVGFLRAVVDEYPGRALVAEMGLPPARAARYHAAIDVPFNFGLITEPWEPRRLARRIAAHLDALPAGAEPNWVLGEPRRAPRGRASRLSPGESRRRAADDAARRAHVVRRRRARPSGRAAAARRPARPHGAITRSAAGADAVGRLPAHGLLGARAVASRLSGLGPQRRCPARRSGVDVLAVPATARAPARAWLGAGRRTRALGDR